MRAVLPALPIAALPCGCAYWVKPKTVTRYNDDCEIGFRQMVLTAEQVPLLEHACNGAACGEQALGALSMTPVSAIVSGSIVRVGNTVYWIQKQGRRCEEAAGQLAS